MKIVLVQCGNDHEMLIEMSMLIGLKKHHPACKIIWIGETRYFDLVRYNKRIDKYLSIDDATSFEKLPLFFKPDLCINPSLHKTARTVVSLANATMVHGFNNDGPSDHQAEFFGNIVSGKLSTNKTVLDLYYGLAGMKWKGEGYGLSYYPRTKQTKSVGIYLQEQQTFSMPSKLLARFDIINQFAEITTDDLFVTHASLALRKKVTLIRDNLPYQIHFFKNGCHEKKEQPSGSQGV